MRIKPKMRVDEIIPNMGTSRQKRKMMPWMWGLVGAVCAMVVYCGGVMAYATDWTLVFTEDELVEVGDITGDDQSSGFDKTSGSVDSEEEKPDEKPVKPDPSVPDEKPVQPINPRPNVPVDTPDTQGKKVIALTFDDGPSAATTPRLLDLLKARNVKVTFFVLGTMAQRSPDVLKREAAEGHEVASHTPYHNQLTLLSFAQVRAEAVEMDRIFTEILGTRPPFTRPPYGAFNVNVQNALAQPLVLWSIDPRDWQDKNANTVCTRVVNAAKDGAIILVHDIHATTVDAVPCIIDSLWKQGYEFLTVSELAKARGVTMVNGGVYYNF